jgi:hypothetical protein
MEINKCPRGLCTSINLNRIYTNKIEKAKIIKTHAINENEIISNVVPISLLKVASIIIGVKTALKLKLKKPIMLPKNENKGNKIEKINLFMEIK